MSLAFQCQWLPLPPLVHLEGQGGDPWVGEVLRTGYLIPSHRLLPDSIKGSALRGEILSLIEKGAVELAPPSPGYLSSGRCQACGDL